MNGVFTPETRERHDPGQRQAAHEKRPVRDRQDATQATELPHVNHAPHGVHHAARAQEQQRFEERMREQMKHAGGDSGRGPVPSARNMYPAG